MRRGKNSGVTTAGLGMGLVFIIILVDSVEQLAEMVNMSSSGFYKNFKAVMLMHLSLLQYTKSVELFKAQTHSAT